MRNFQNEPGRLRGLGVALLISVATIGLPAQAQSEVFPEKAKVYLIQNILSHNFPYSSVGATSSTPGGVFQYSLQDYSEPILKRGNPESLKKFKQFFSSAFLIPGINQVRLDVTPLAVKSTSDALPEAFVITGVKQPGMTSFKLTSRVLESGRGNGIYPYGSEGYRIQADLAWVDNQLASTFPEYDVRLMGGGSAPEGKTMEYAIRILPNQKFSISDTKVRAKLIGFFQKSFGHAYGAVIRIQVFQRSLQDFYAAYPPRLMTLRITRLEMESAARAERSPVISVLDGRFGLPAKEINGTSGRDVASEVWKIFSKLEVAFYWCNTDSDKFSKVIHESARANAPIKGEGTSRARSRGSCH